MDDGSEVFLEGVSDTELFEGQRLKRGEAIGSFAKDTPVSYRIIRNGESIDIRNVNSLDPTMNRDAARRPQTEQEALAIAGSIDRREIRDGVKQRISQRYSQDRAMAAQENQRVVEAVTRAQMTDPNAIDPALFAALTPAQQSDVIGYKRKANDMDIMLQIAENPRILTRQFVFDNKSKLTNDTFIKLLDQVGSGKLIEATVDADMVNATIASVGFKDITPEQNLQMRVNIENKIYEMQSYTGKKLDRDQKQMIIDKTMADTVVKPLWFGRESEPMPAAIYTPSELEGQMVTLNPARRAAVNRYLQSEGIKNPTPSQFEAAWKTLRKIGTK
jgi:hypothetical protein